MDKPKLIKAADYTPPAPKPKRQPPTAVEVVRQWVQTQPQPNAREQFRALFK